MDRVAIFVDAGYLFAHGSALIAGTRLKRAETSLDEEKAIAFLKGLAKELSALPLLRLYWYDGTNAGPTAVHTALAFRPDVKVRLGAINAFGEQKGVDSLIVSDLIELSRNRAMADAVLLAGDEDVRIGVQKAQEVGVRVHLVGIEPAQHNQSSLLRQEADTLCEISKAELEAFLMWAPTSAGLPGGASPALEVPAGTDPLEAVAEAFAKSLAMADVERVLQDPGGSVPQDIDRGLLRMGSFAGDGRALTSAEKRDLRRAFLRICKGLL